MILGKMWLWIISSSILAAYKPPENEETIMSKVPGATFNSNKLRQLISKDVEKFPKFARVHVILGLGGNDLFPGRLIRNQNLHHHTGKFKTNLPQSLKEFKELVVMIENTLEKQDITYNISFFPLLPRVDKKCCNIGLNYPYEESLVIIRSFEMQLKQLHVCRIFELHKCIARFTKEKKIPLETMQIENPKKLNLRMIFNKNYNKVKFFRKFQRSFFAPDQIHLGKYGNDFVNNTIDFITS